MVLRLKVIDDDMEGDTMTDIDIGVLGKRTNGTGTGERLESSTG